MKILIVGSGFFGSVCAHELHKLGHIVTVLEKRSHIGGNCYTKYEKEAGCHRHVYGPHIFHTSNEDVWNYVNRFSSFNHFVNRPKANISGKLYSLPINLDTISQVFKVNTPEAARKAVRNDIECYRGKLDLDTLEGWCISQVGPTLYRLFVKGYTEKQWGKSANLLPSYIIKRLPIRFYFDDNYYNDKYQGIPIGGYTEMFERLLYKTPPQLGVDFLSSYNDPFDSLQDYDFVIYTGSLDSLLRYKMGVLEYREVMFEDCLIRKPDFQGVAQMNYPSRSVGYTRTIEHKHFDMERDTDCTIVSYEYPKEWNPGSEPYYPLNDFQNRSKYEKMKSIIPDRFIVGGRLGDYKYYDMHHVIASALHLVKKFR